VHDDRGRGVKACLLLARFALATVLAVALAALAVYAAGAHIRQSIDNALRLKPDRLGDSEPERARRL
jgi:hypothetical protein